MRWYSPPPHHLLPKGLHRRLSPSGGKWYCATPNKCNCASAISPHWRYNPKYNATNLTASNPFHWQHTQHGFGTTNYNKSPTAAPGVEGSTATPPLRVQNFPFTLPLTQVNYAILTPKLSMAKLKKILPITLKISPLSFPTFKQNYPPCLILQSNMLSIQL